MVDMLLHANCIDVSRIKCKIHLRDELTSAYQYHEIKKTHETAAAAAITAAAAAIAAAAAAAAASSMHVTCCCMLTLYMLQNYIKNAPE